MPAYQGPKKQGDHVFAKDLPRLFDDLLERVDADLGRSPEGKTLTSALTTCLSIASRPVYRLTVDKGIASVDGDAHSVEYGARAQALRYAMINYINAVKNRQRPVPPLTAPPAERDRFMRAIVDDEHFVRSAVENVTLSVSEWARSALDVEAATLLRGKKAEVAEGQEGIKQMMAIVLAAVRRH